LFGLWERIRRDEHARTNGLLGLPAGQDYALVSVPAIAGNVDETRLADSARGTATVDGRTYGTPMAANDAIGHDES